MKKAIDCFIIGHNEENFEKYVRNLRNMGINSGAYRDLNLSFIQYENHFFHAKGIFNMLAGNSGSAGKTITPLNDGELFSATVSYLGSYLDRRGFTFDYVNSFQAELEILARKLEQENILTIAVTTTYYISVLPLLEIMSFIRAHNHSALVIIGGPFIATQCRVSDPETLAYIFKSIGADIYVNSSQGEAALADIVESVKKNKSLDNISNIYYKEGGIYKKNPLSRENNSLSENMVTWDLFSDRLGRYANLRTAISCPFSCSFCGFPEHAGKYQTVDVEIIENNLNRLQQIDKVQSLHIIDDTFNVPVKRFKDILRMMIKNKYRFKWHSYFRCQFADREVVELMRECGCEGVFLGIESGNNQILSNMNKVSNIESYLKGIELLKENDILTYGSFIIGFPGETVDTVQDTIKFIEESQIDFYRTQLWYCDTMTPIWKEREKYDIKGSNFEWSHGTLNSKDACDLIDSIFLSVKKSVWLPQWGFDFTNIFQLRDRGIELAKTREFLNSFNEGIREKIVDPSRTEVSPEIMNRLKNSFANDNATFREKANDGKTKQRQKQELIIDFDLD